MQTSQDKPSIEQALAFLNGIKDHIAYDDINASTNEGATKLAARWACFDMAIETLAIAHSALLFISSDGAGTKESAAAVSLAALKGKVL